MAIGAIIGLLLQGLVFVAWAFMMFRTLFTFRARDAAQGGGPFPSTGGFIAQMKYWLKSDEDRRDRRALFVLTLALFVLIAISASTAGAG